MIRPPTEAALHKSNLNEYFEMQKANKNQHITIFWLSLVLKSQVYRLWLVVSTILKNISQWEGFSHILWKLKNVPNHQSGLIPSPNMFHTPRMVPECPRYV
jgi:hypothetical protein